MCYPSNMLHYFMFSLRFCGWLCPITSERVKSGIWASEGEILNFPLSTTATQAIYCKTACRHRDPLSYPVCCSCSCFYFYIRQTEAAACTQRTLPQSGGGGVLPYITRSPSSHYLYGYVPPNGVVILKLLI